MAKTHSSHSQDDDSEEGWAGEAAGQAAQQGAGRLGHGLADAPQGAAGGPSLSVGGRAPAFAVESASARWRGLGEGEEARRRPVVIVDVGASLVAAKAFGYLHCTKKAPTLPPRSNGQKSS